MGSWYESLNLENVGDENRYSILQYVVSKYGREKVQEVLGVSRITMWRLLNRVSRVCLRGKLWVAVAVFTSIAIAISIPISSLMHSYMNVL